MNTIVLELLASRICHDLISPVGAIRNGIEFMEEMGADAGDEALALITHSSDQAAAKLQLFRLVYGAGGGDSAIKPEAVHEAFADFIKTDGKIAQEWDPYGDLGFGDERPGGFCKILAGTLLMAAECLPKGGKITVSAGNEANQTLITATGDNANLRDYYEEALSALLPVQDIDARLVHPYVLGQLAANYGLSVTPRESESGTISFQMSPLS